MAKYRITEYTYYPGGKKKYLIEKRFLGFLWWYDFLEDGLYSDGWCNTYDEALEWVTNHINFKKTKKVVWTDK
jgi:hypothetical protein